MRDHVGKLSWEAGQYIGAIHAMSQFRYDMLIGMMAEEQVAFGFEMPEAVMPSFWGPTFDAEPESLQGHMTWFKLCEFRIARFADDFLIPGAVKDPDFRNKIQYFMDSAANACRLLDKAWDYLCGLTGILICTSCLTRVEAGTDLTEGCPTCGASQGAFAYWNI